MRSGTGRVLYNRTAQHFIIRADRKLHRAVFVHLIAKSLLRRGSRQNNPT
jgi:hypothetical protein